MTTPQPPAHAPVPPQQEGSQGAAGAPPQGRPDPATAMLSAQATQQSPQQAAPQDAATTMLTAQPAPPNAPQTAAPAPQQAAPQGAPQGAPQDAATTMLTAQPAPEGWQKQPPQQPQPQYQQVPPGAQPMGPPAAAGGWHGQPGAVQQAVYTSPLPAGGTHLGHAIASEWTKIRSVRSTMWTLGVAFILTVGISTLIGWGMSTANTAELPVLSPGFFGLMLGHLGIITLGVLVITAEYSTGMIRTTLTACPKRSRVLTAKALVFFTVSFTTTLLATGLTSVLLSAMLDGKPLEQFADPEMFPAGSIVNGEVVATGSEWLGATVGVSLYVALLGLLSLAVGTLLRSSPGAITAMIGLVLLPFLVSLFLWAESVRELGEKMREYSVLNGLSSLYRLPMAGDMSGTGWPLLGLLAAVTGVALIGAYARITARDV